MDTRVAVISIIVENGEMVETLNLILHGYGEYINSVRYDRQSAGSKRKDSIFRCDKS